MIVQSFPAKEKPASAAQTGIIKKIFERKQAAASTPPPILALPEPAKGEPRDVYAATKRKIHMEVYMARDRIVRQNAQNCPFRVGEEVMPRTREDQETYGKCRILAICQNYYDYGDDAWPESNVPLIVHFEVINPPTKMKNHQFFGTINFFEKANEPSQAC